MASGYGFVLVGGRPFAYARYIDWVLTTPLLLMDLMMLAKVDWTRIIQVIFMDIIMVITGLLGGLVTESYKWGFFVFGCVACRYFARWSSLSFAGL
jgi:bacteriorhodopsin